MSYPNHSCSHQILSYGANHIKSMPLFALTPSKLPNHKPLSERELTTIYNFIYDEFVGIEKNDYYYFVNLTDNDVYVYMPIALLLSSSMIISMATLSSILSNVLPYFTDPKKKRVIINVLLLTTSLPSKTKLEYLKSYRIKPPADFSKRDKIIKTSYNVIKNLSDKVIVPEDFTSLKLSDLKENEMFYPIILQNIHKFIDPLKRIYNNNEKSLLYYSDFTVSPTQIIKTYNKLQNMTKILSKFSSNKSQDILTLFESGKRPSQASLKFYKSIADYNSLYNIFALIKKRYLFLHSYMTGNNNITSDEIYYLSKKGLLPPEFSKLVLLYLVNINKNIDSIRMDIQLVNKNKFQSPLKSKKILPLLKMYNDFVFKDIDFNDPNSLLEALIRADILHLYLLPVIKKCKSSSTSKQPYCLKYQVPIHAQKYLKQISKN